MKHKHAELIKAWADAPQSALFQEDFGNGWSSNYTGDIFDFSESNDYRIAPDCDYAIEKIREVGGDEAVELYHHFLVDASNLEIYDNYSESVTWLQMEYPEDDPFSEFLHEWAVSNGKIRKKKQTVKQVLWVYYSKNGGDMTCPMLWVIKGDDIQSDCWHKVPTCTREVDL